MGTYRYTIMIDLQQSAHNSINDDLDAVRTKWLLTELRRLIEHPNYASLRLELSHDIEPWRCGN